MMYQGTATGIATGMSYQLLQIQARLRHSSSAKLDKCESCVHMLRTPMYIASLSPEIESIIIIAIIVIIHNTNVPTFNGESVRNRSHIKTVSSR